MSASELIIPGTGAVFIAEPDTEVPDVALIDFKKESTFTGWKWLGHTSRENAVALSKEGGEPSTLGSWEDPALRSENSATTWSMTVNALEVTKETLQLALPNGVWDDTKKSLRVSGNTGAIDKAVLVVMKDNKNGQGAILFPNGAVSLGEAPSISVESFFEIQLNVVGQGSPKTGANIEIFTVRKSQTSHS